MLSEQDATVSKMQSLSLEVAEALAAEERCAFMNIVSRGCYNPSNMSTLRKPVKGNLISATPESTSVLQSDHHLIKRSCTSNWKSYCRPLLHCLDSFERFRAFNPSFLLFSVRALCVPFVAIIIAIYQIYNYYREDNDGKHSTVLHELDQKMAVCIDFGNLNNGEHVEDQVHQFIKEQSENFWPQATINRRLYTGQVSKKGGIGHVRPLVLSFPTTSTRNVESILNAFASVRIDVKNTSKEQPIKNITNETDECIKRLEYKHHDQKVRPVTSVQAITGHLKSKFQESMLENIAMVTHSTLDHFQSAKFVVDFAMQDLTSYYCSLIQKSVVDHRDVTHSFCDPLPADLLQIIKGKANTSSETLTLSIISRAISCYFSLVTGNGEGHLIISHGNWNDTKSAIRLPIRTSAEDEMSLFGEISHIISKSKVWHHGLSGTFSSREESLPSSACRLIIEQSMVIEVEHVHLCHTSSSMPNALVKSVYLWSDVCIKYDLKILVIHQKGGIIFTMTSAKEGPIKSASLFAECIAKSVSSLCYNLDIKWDRRSPPSTPNVE